MPSLVYEDDVPEVRMPSRPPMDGNVKDLELYCGSVTIELERLHKQLDLYKQMLSTGGYF